VGGVPQVPVVGIATQFSNSPGLRIGDYERDSNADSPRASILTCPPVQAGHQAVGCPSSSTWPGCRG
jgi:hypothetical protein